MPAVCPPCPTVCSQRACTHVVTRPSEYWHFCTQGNDLEYNIAVILWISLDFLLISRCFGMQNHKFTNCSPDFRWFPDYLGYKINHLQFVSFDFRWLWDEFGCKLLNLLFVGCCFRSDFGRAVTIVFWFVLIPRSENARGIMKYWHVLFLSVSGESSIGKGTDTYFQYFQGRFSWIIYVSVPYKKQRLF